MDTATVKQWRFQPVGATRFLPAGFLMVWLCGWLVGEIFVLTVLIVGLWALLTGSPPPGKNAPLEIMPTLAVGGFLLIWLTFWTIGGLGAMRELLRLLWAEDCIELGRDGLVLTRRLGPRVRRRQLAHSAIRQISLQRPRSELVAQVGTEWVTLTDLGTVAERESAAVTLQAALSLPAEPATTAGLPVGWREIHELRGGVVVVPDPRVRRQRAHVVFFITGVVWSGVLLLVRGSLREPTLWGVTAMLGALGLWLIRQTLWMYRGRKEWRIEPGRLVHQRRYGDEITELAEVRSLELTESSDSDGDRWYALDAVAVPRPGQKSASITILKTLHDPTAPRSLGRWLAQRAKIPLHDRVPTEADRRAEMQRQLEALAQSGKVGSWLARQLKKTGRVP